VIKGSEKEDVTKGGVIAALKEFIRAHLK